ncbi:MAG: hypothetical protein JW993_02660 [Sedimentisphaerales bacterium]|nr:hypothetical protein [Sedimentisphaerales bacterium]
MTAKRVLKRIHVVSTAWFILSVGYVLAVALEQAGFGRWLNVSLSVYSAVVTLLCTGFYLFALFRGVGGAQNIVVEHPLTTTSHYMAFYVTAPLLGGLAGVLGMLGTPDVPTFVLGVARGTLYTTFAVWVILDPLAGLIEMTLPSSRRHRAERLAQAEAERRARAERRERLLAEAFAREEQERRRWEERLQNEAERLAVLLTTDAAGFEKAEKEALDIGAFAWRLGGLTCMQQLRDMALEIARERAGGSETVDYVSHWWDGIGNWRRPSFG